MMHPMTCYGFQQVKRTFEIPTVEHIYRFAKHLFTNAQLSSECTIVCLVYVERLMERGNIGLLATNWRPILLCGLLLASKVWQDLSSWNVEFRSPPPPPTPRPAPHTDDTRSDVFGLRVPWLGSTIYPQFTVSNINRLERNFLHHIRWDL
jgi:hypothetical protein